MSRRAVLPILLAVLNCTAASAQPGWHAEVGYTQLVEEFADVADGSGVAVALVEGAGGGGFMPDVANAEFAEIDITQGSPGEPTVSEHATGMGATFFGRTTSLCPGIRDATCLSANHWMGIWLATGTPFAPQPMEFAVSNHSYIGDGLPEEIAVNVLQRLDFAIDEYGMTAVVGINNGSGTSQPQLMSHAHNVISVGKTDGNHSRGETSIYGRGRPKPELVAPAGTTSESTAMVSSAAALLYDAAGESNATRPEVIRAMLLAGATKSECADWARTITQPLDPVYGAGELNVYHSYRIVAGGEAVEFDAEPAKLSPGAAWHYNADAAADVPTFYEIDLENGGENLSIALCWNVDVIDGDPGETFVPSTELADMTLRLYDSTGGFLRTLVDSSIDTEGNIEHIYQESLPPARYTIEVMSNVAHDYGIAWRVDEDAD
jgi:hypothetical protein